MAVDPAAAADRRAGSPAEHPALGAGRARVHPGRRAGADRGHSQRSERRLPTPAPGHGRLGRAVVLAAHRHRGVTPPSLDEWIDDLPGPAGPRPEARRPTRRRGRPCTDGRLGGPECGRGTQPAIRRRPGQSTRFWRTTPGCASAKRSPASRGSSTGSSTSRPCSRDGGFDLQLGNPPWVRPRHGHRRVARRRRSWWQLATKPSEAARKAKRAATLALPGIRDLVIERDNGRRRSLAEYLGSAQAYPLSGRIAARLVPMLYGADLEACVT